MTLRVAAWSGPRNLSTALMYAFAARGDCAVRDEPFYAAYLAATGIEHPLRAAVLAAQPADPAAVARACGRDDGDGRPLTFQKHMTLHLLPGFPRDWMRACRHVFLIRHPARVAASYARARAAPTLDDLGFRQQAALFDEVAGWAGAAPPVVAAEALRADPAGALAALCARLGIPWTPRMLSWEAGPKPFDGAWAPHWYGAVHRSTGWGGPEGPLPDLPPALARLAAAGMDSYERLLRLA